MIDFEKMKQPLDGCGATVPTALNLLGRSIRRLRKVLVLLELLDQLTQLHRMRIEVVVVQRALW